MPLFQCEKCGCIENTACADGYWCSIINNSLKICSECDSQTAKWHDRFPKRDAVKEGYYTDGKHIYGPDEVDPIKMVWKYNGAKIKGLCKPIKQ